MSIFTIVANDTPDHVLVHAAAAVPSATMPITRRRSNREPSPPAFTLKVLVRWLYRCAQIGPASSTVEPSHAARKHRAGSRGAKNSGRIPCPGRHTPVTGVG